MQYYHTCFFTNCFLMYPQHRPCRYVCSPHMYILVLTGQLNWFETCDFLDACLGFAGLGRGQLFSSHQPFHACILSTDVVSTRGSVSEMIEVLHTGAPRGDYQEGRGRNVRQIYGGEGYGCHTPLLWVHVWFQSSERTAFLYLH